MVFDVRVLLCTQSDFLTDSHPDTNTCPVPSHNTSHSQDGAQIDSIGASMLDISNKMTDTAASLTMGFQEDILAAFDADVLQDAVQTIIDDATIRRPRRGGPGGETMAALQSQHNKEAAALAQSVP